MTLPDPSQMRISDGDRHEVYEILRDAAAEGRIDWEELDERIEAVHAAKVYADLTPITIDLPNSQLIAPSANFTGPARHGGREPIHASSVGVLSEVRRGGKWVLPTSHTALAMMGSVKLDLREVGFTAHESVITASAIMGEVVIVVNTGTHVIVDGVAFMGEFKQARDRALPDYGPQAPVIRVKGLALMGTVTVIRKRMPGEPGKIKKMLGY